MEGDWDVDRELRAQLIEEVSILASDRRRPDPVRIPRPAWLIPPRTARPGDGHKSGPDPAFARAIDHLFETTPGRAGQ